MENVHLTESVYGTWKADDVAYIVSVRWNGSEDGCLDLETLVQPSNHALGAWPQRGGPWFRVCAAFRGVKDLQIKNFGVGPRQVTGFAVDDVRYKQLEAIAYSVEDYESGIISFLSRTAAIVSVESEKSFFSDCN